MDIPVVQVHDIPDPLPESLHVLDVREDDEWAAGHIEGATHLPLHELPARIDEMDGEHQLLVVCKSGGRSAQATTWLQQRGTNAINVDGGMLEWAAAGRPMVREGGGDPEVV